MKIKQTSIMILFILIVLYTIAYAQISGYEKETLPDLNQQIRYTDRRINEIENYSDLSQWETATDDGVVVGNGTTFDTKILPSCSNATTSKLLYTTATNALSCGTDQDSAGMTLLSTTTVTSTANSGNITFTSASPHLIIFRMREDSTDDNGTIHLRFESDSEADYQDGDGDAQNEIDICTLDIGGEAFGKIYFYQDSVSADVMWVFGEVVHENDAGGLVTRTEFYGHYDDDDNVTPDDFEIYSNNGMSSIKVMTYQLDV